MIVVQLLILDRYVYPNFRVMSNQPEYLVFLVQPLLIINKDPISSINEKHYK